MQREKTDEQRAADAAYYRAREVSQAHPDKKVERSSNETTQRLVWAGGKWDGLLYWSHGAKVFALGDLADEFLAGLPPEIVGSDVPAFRSFRASVDDWNVLGWNRTRPRVEQLVRDLRDIGFSLNETDWKRMALARLLDASPEPKSQIPDENARRSFEDQIRDFLGRDFRGADSSKVFWLLAALDAHLIEIRGTTRKSAGRMMANLGAGRVLFIEIQKFPTEERAEFVIGAREERVPVTYHPTPQPYGLDGGDVHISLMESYDEMLEGTFLCARYRRRDEARVRESEERGDWYIETPRPRG